MKREVIINIVTALLILLWSYTALSKLADLEEFRRQMLNQPLPNWIGYMITWFLPFIELALAGILLTSYRLAGLYGSLALMLIFTAYVASVLLGAFDRVPCSCGGVISQMSWETHLIFNIMFAGIAGAGITFTHKKGGIIT